MKNIVKLFYIIVPIAVIILFLNAIIGKTISNEHRYTSFSSDWTFYLNDKKLGVFDLPYHVDCDRDDVVKITKRLDKDFKFNTLMYLSAYQSFKVSVDNELVYSFDTSENSKPTKALGHFWQFMDIDDDYKGKEFEIEISSPYSSKAGMVEEIYVGNNSSLVEMLFDKHFTTVIMALFMIFFASLCIFLFFYFKDYIKNKKGVIYLALVSFLGGVWIFADSNLWQFFSTNITLGYMLTYVSLYFMPTAVCLYTKNGYNIKHAKYMDILVVLNVIFVLITIMLQLLEIYDFKETLPVFHILAFITIVVFFVTCCVEMRVNKDIRYLLISVMFFAITGIINLITLMAGLFNETTVIFQIGVFAFLVYQMTNMVKSFNALTQIKNTNKILAQLAYNDELTGLQNRTAYQRRLERLNEKWIDNDKLLAVVMDLNNLKLANDNYGHLVGDELIKTAGGFIGEAFMPDCEVYRIGGDEFVALCEETTKEKCRGFIKNLNKLTVSYNITNPQVILEIAIGYSFVDKARDNKIEDLIARCDEKMYANKAELKRNTKVS